MEKNNRCIVCVLFLAGILCACGSGASSPPDQGASPTAAATAAGQTPSPVVPSPTSESNPEPQESPVSPAEELSPNPTQAFTGKIPLCNDSLFVDDVTIPDGTVLAPEEKFVKTWKFKNFGACQWTTSYAIGFAYGDERNRNQAAHFRRSGRHGGHPGHYDCAQNRGMVRRMVAVEGCVRRLFRGFRVRLHSGIRRPIKQHAHSGMVNGQTSVPFCIPNGILNTPWDLCNSDIERNSRFAAKPRPRTAPCPFGYIGENIEALNCDSTRRLELP
jgi:hypothetical protein